MTDKIISIAPQKEEQNNWLINYRSYIIIMFLKSLLFKQTHKKTESFYFFSDNKNVGSGFHAAMAL